MIPVLAIDPSLTSCGWAIHDGTQLHHGLIRDKTPGRPKLTGSARRLHHAGQIRNLARRHEARLVVAEGLFVGGYPGATIALARFRGTLEDALWGAGFLYIEVPPKTVKAYGCGRGNADKAAMVAAARDQHGYRGRSHDEADAIHLHALTLDALGQGYAPDLGDPAARQKRRDAIATVVPLVPTAGVL